MRFGSDVGSMTPEVKILESNIIIQAFTEILLDYLANIRDEKVISLEEVIKKLTYNYKDFKIKNRGLLKKGYYADIVIFDKDKIKRCPFSTFQIHQFSTGVIHVFCKWNTST